jgi:hypothetical protein
MALQVLTCYGEQRKMSKSDRRMLTHLNKAKVKVEELEAVVREAERRHEMNSAKDGDGLFLVLSMFSHAGPQKVQAIYFRLFALARLIAREHLPGWTEPERYKGAVLTHQALIDSAAICPLAFVDGDIGFDKTVLLQKALELVQPQGRC